MMILFLILLLVCLAIFAVFTFRPTSEAANFSNITISVRHSLLNFPLVLCFSLLTASVVIYSIHIEELTLDLNQLILAFAFGISISFCFYLFFRTHKYKHLLALLSLPVVGLFYYLQRDLPLALSLIRWAQLFLLSHLLASFIAFLKETSQEKFWQFNKDLLIAFFVASAYSTFILFGISIAFGAFQYLFEVTNFSKIYFTNAAICYFFVQPCIFLGIIRPKICDDKNLNLDQLKALKAFSSLVLVPIVFIYLLILIAYEVKIAFVGELPKGMVGWLVCVFGLIGTLTWLLTYPLGKNGTGLVRLFHKRFFHLFIPLLALLFIAVFERISNYGFTELRYLLLLLTIWISIITVLFTIKPSAQIKLIPISLFLLALVTLYGPLSAEFVSFKSQIFRLEKLLLSKTECQKSVDNQITLEDAKEINSILEYLATSHTAKTYKHLSVACKNNSEALAIINRYIEINNADNKNRYYERSTKLSFTRELLETLGIARINKYDRISDINQSNFKFNAIGNRLNRVDKLNISGLETFYKNIWAYPAEIAYIKKKPDIYLSLHGSKLIVYHFNKTATIDLTTTIDKILENTKSKYLPDAVPQEELTVDHIEKGVLVRVFIHQIIGKKEAGLINIRSLEGDVGIGQVVSKH